MNYFEFSIDSSQFRSPTIYEFLKTQLKICKVQPFFTYQPSKSQTVFSLSQNHERHLYFCPLILLLNPIQNHPVVNVLNNVIISHPCPSFPAPLPLPSFLSRHPSRVVLVEEERWFSSVQNPKNLQKL